MFNTPIMATIENTKYFAQYFRSMSIKLSFRLQSKFQDGE